MDLAALVLDIHDGGERLAEIGLGHFHPDGVDMGAHEVTIAEIDPRRGYRPGYHLVRLAEVILVVWAAARAVGVNKCRLATASGAAAALSIVRRRGRNVAQI